MDTPSEVIGIGQPQVESRAAPISAEAEKAAYDQAFQALKELRYADAAEEFQSFLDRFPNSEYSDNAQYWLGESYYVTRNYDIALSAFEELLGHRVRQQCALGIGACPWRGSSPSRERDEKP